MFQKDDLIAPGPDFSFPDACSPDARALRFGDYHFFVQSLLPMSWSTALIVDASQDLTPNGIFVATVVSPVA